MTSGDVLFEVSCLSKALITPLTRERLASRVSSTVHVETAGAHERFTTKATEEFPFTWFFLRPLFFLVYVP